MSWMRGTVVPVVLAVVATALVAAQSGEGVDILLGKARSLEARGRMDLAAQNWNQVLLVNPNQTDALAGLARYAKQNGDAAGVRVYLDRLRKVNPRDPAIAAVERMRVLTAQDRARLDEAVRLSGQKRPEEAMKIYREVFGSDPPSGKYAEVFYQTQATTATGRPDAIAQLRGMTARDPGNEVYRFWLARILSYEPTTRLEALRLLESIRDSGTAEQARPVWRQALVWEKENPAVQSSVEVYLKRYPDPELTQAAARLKDHRDREQQDADRRRGFLALRQKDMSTAEREFEDVLRRSPKDVNAMAGLGFVRLDQKRFADALEIFDKARALAPKRADISEGYENAQYWATIQRAQALETRDADAAVAAYEAALGLRPQEQQPVLAIAQIMLRRDNLPAAATRFEQVLTRSPSNADALAGLGFVRLKEKNFAAAVSLLGKARTLAPNRREVEDGYRSATFWGVVNDASAALEQGRTEAAMKGFEQALTIDPKSRDALLGLAGAAERTRNHKVALDAYDRLAQAAADDVRAWLGLVRVQIASKDTAAAIRTFQRLPAAVRQKVETRPDYLAELSLVLYAQGRESDGDQVLQHALEAARRDDSEDALATRLQLADLLVQQGRGDRAVRIYTQATERHPTEVLAWQGLIGAYATARDFDRALAAVRAMPPATYDLASRNPGFLNAVAAGYSAAGRCGEAENLLTRSLDLDRAAGRTQSPGTQLQLGDIWMRQARYDKAVEAFRAVIAADPASVDAWRGYITALHNRNDDRTVLAESRRLPAPTRAELAKDPGITTLIAAAHAGAGEYDESVALLEDARRMYQGGGQVPPAEFDLQLGWVLLKSSKSYLVGDLITRARTRTDLTADQRAAFEEMWLSSVFARVDAAMTRNDVESAVTLLTVAWREAPTNPKIPSALAAVHLKKGDRSRALEVYQTWGLQGANAGDYRAAAGAALAQRDTLTADRFMLEGLKQFPNDRDLLRMKGRQAVNRGDYRDAEKLLTAALAAKPEPASTAKPRAPAPPSPRSQQAPERACTQDAPRATASGVRWTMPVRPRIMLASMRQTAGAPAPPAQTPQTPPPSTSAPPNTDGVAASDASAQTPQGTAPSERTDEIEDDIDVVKNRNTPFASGGLAFSGRAGDPGLSRLVVRDVTPGGQATFGNAVRVGVDLHSLTLTSGIPDGLSGYRFGTLPLGARFVEQQATGYVAEIQVAGTHFGASVGTPASEFLTKLWTGGLRLGPAAGPFRLIAVRERVKDSLLSYAGERDPGTGLVWGGVVSNAVSIQTSHDNEGDGVYLTLGGSLLRGENVANNWSAEASAGSYWSVGTGGPTSLTIGVAGTALHYDKNLSFFSLGHGGYFSPQRFLQGSIPLSWSIRHSRVFYEMQVSPGFQYFTADGSPIYPIGIGSTPPSAFATQTYDEQQRRGATYNVTARLEYRLAPHVHLSAFGAANNTRDFDARAIGLAVKLLAYRLPGTTNLRVRAVPDWRGNQPLGN